MIRLAKPEEMGKILEIFDKAKAFMRENGNKNQWADGYPSAQDLEEDLENKSLYVIDQDGPQAVFAMIREPEPTYEYIEGAWNSDERYFTIHRVASNGRVKGVFKKAVDFCLQESNCVRVDTHRDNIPMQRAILGCGFKYCGIIYLENGDERLAYDLNI